MKLRFNGFAAGRYERFGEGKICYLNGNEFVWIKRDKQTFHVLLKRSLIKVGKDGSLQHTNIQVANFRKSDQIRIYQEVTIAKDDIGSKSPSQFIPNFIMEPRNGQNRFYFTYDQNTNNWIGKWGKPKRNYHLTINSHGDVCYYHPQILEKSEKIEAQMNTKVEKQIEKQVVKEVQKQLEEEMKTEFISQDVEEDEIVWISNS